MTPTLVSSLVPTLHPTSTPSESPSLVSTSLLPDPTQTSVPTNKPEDQENTLIFAESVQEYVQTVWGTWEQGETVGQCLIDNVLSISVSAREVITQYGVEEAFGKLDGPDLQSLSEVWDLCETQTTSAGAETAETMATSTTSKINSTPELDEAFKEAVGEYMSITWSTWDQGQSIGQCLIATAGSMTPEAKEGVIQHGIEEAFGELSGTHLQSFSDAWDRCKSEADTAESIPTEEQGYTSTEEASTPTVTIDIERAPAPTFGSLTSYNQFEDALQSSFMTSVDTEFDALAEKAGISVAVYSDGRMWQYAKGIANSSHEMSVSTPIEIKSSSKTFMSALILDQVEDGLYSLSDTVSNVLADHPGYSSVDRARINPEVTIGELLRMKSGLNTYHGIGENFVAIEKDPTWKPIEYLNMTPIGYSDPGIYEYNDTNTIILAIIAEHAAGKPLNELYKSRFLDPLDIVAGLLPQDYAPHDTADEYGDISKCGDFSGFGNMIEACSWYTRDEWLLSQGKHNWAAAGIISTADNMARWAYELYSYNGSALSESSRSQLLNSGSAEPILFANKTHHYGYHLAIFSMVLIDGTELDIYGHIGGAGKSVLYYSPDLDLSVAILANSSLDRVRGVCSDHTMPFCILRSIYQAYR